MIVNNIQGITRLLPLLLLLLCSFTVTTIILNYYLLFMILLFTDYKIRTVILNIAAGSQKKLCYVKPPFCSYLIETPIQQVHLMSNMINIYLKVNKITKSQNCKNNEQHRTQYEAWRSCFCLRVHLLAVQDAKHVIFKLSDLNQRPLFQF